MRVFPGIPLKQVPKTQSLGPSRSRLNSLETAARSISKTQLLGASFNWGMWLFLSFLVLSQLLTAVNNSTRSITVYLFGQHPSDGLYKIPGLNDEPYSDRAVVCARYGKRYKAVLLSDALASGSIMIEDTTGSAIHGYRVVNRSGHILNPKAKQGWTRTCRLIDSTLDFIFTACESMGYTNLTRDDIRIVEGVSSKTLKRIPNSLPILIMPFYDNNPSARYAIPGWDGHACVFRLTGKYENHAISRTYMFGVNQSIRVSQTIKWLNQPGGVWRNGWYEDLTGSKWYADVLSTDPLNTFNVKARQFDPTAGRELYCRDKSDCLQRTLDSRYAEFHTATDASKLLSITISNGSRYGLFYYRSVAMGVVECAYDFATFVSNASVIALLFRWMVAMVTLHRSYHKRLSVWHSANVGSIANSYSFTILPIAMIPRLKIIMASFLTVGCQFEGAQVALADAWFVIYPSIVCLVLVYASLLNSLSKVLRRRMSDITITPTILVLSILHYSRIAIAQTSFIPGGRLSTLVSADEFDKFATFDLFTPKTALRMGGNASSLLILKLVVLSISLLPLIFSENMSTKTKRSRLSRTCCVERTLTVRACNIGGIGQSSLYESYSDSTSTMLMLNSYELTRLGYVVLGNRYLMTFENWMIITTTERMRLAYSLWNHRIMVFKVSDKSKESDPKVFQVSDYGQLVSLNDPIIKSFVWWDVDARPFLNAKDTPETWLLHLVTEVAGTHSSVRIPNCTSMRGRTQVSPIKKLEINSRTPVVALQLDSSNKSVWASERIEGPRAISRPATVVRSSKEHSITKRQICGAVYNWSLWSFSMVLVLSQLLTIITNTTISYPAFEFGQNVSAGPFVIPGQNDEPYSDRLVVCVRRGKNIQAMGLSEALASKSAIVEDTTGDAMHGYRVVNRTISVLSDDRKRAWTRTCRLIESTIDFLFSMCDSFGYNITRDNLRISDDVYSKTLKRIPKSLPVLIMPLWDNSPLGRYVTPGWDGHACFFHLSGNYEDPSIGRAYAFGLNRSVRETLAIDWLGRPGGKWKHGWYEDLQGMRWHADMISTNPHDSSAFKVRQFDAVTQRELACHASSDCMEQTVISNWGSKFLSTRYLTGLQNVIISNGYRYGFFYVNMEGPNIVTCMYDLSAFLSNASVISLLIRWMLVMLTLHRSFYNGHTAWYNADIGSFANASSFIILPVAMLPRLKMILAAFYTIGCEFEGEQKALGDSWFVMYPSIVNIGFLNASLLNMVAKVFRRRVNSWTFGFMILSLSGLHWFRVSIAQSSLFGIGGRITVLVRSDEFDRLGLLDFLNAETAMRMNGNVSSLLVIKLVVMLVSFFAPLLCFSENMGLHTKRSRTVKPCSIEKALAIRACNVGGIGQSSIYENNDKSHMMLNSYELIRLGYIVVGHRYLMTWDNWFVLTTVDRMRSVYTLWNYRIMAFRVTELVDANGMRTYFVSKRPEHMRLTDPNLNRVQWWDIDARPIP